MSSTTWGILPADVAAGVRFALELGPIQIGHLARQRTEMGPFSLSIEGLDGSEVRTLVVWLENPNMWPVLVEFIPETTRTFNHILIYFWSRLTVGAICGTVDSNNNFSLNNCAVFAYPPHVDYIPPAYF
jgi:hypothetical protein